MPNVEVKQSDDNKRQNVKNKQRELNEKKLKDKKRKHEDNIYKYKKSTETGISLAGGKEKFGKCMQFFSEKVENCDELGDIEVEEINNYIGQFGVNSPQITTLVYQLYNLNKEIEGDVIAIMELEEKINQLN